MLASKGVEFTEYDITMGGEKAAEMIARKPDVVLVASGSEVATLVEGAKLLKEKEGLKIQIVSSGVASADNTNHTLTK